MATHFLITPFPLITNHSLKLPPLIRSTPSAKSTPLIRSTPSAKSTPLSLPYIQKCSFLCCPIAPAVLDSSFLQKGTHGSSQSRQLSTRSAQTDSGNTSSLTQNVFGVLHLIVSLGLFVATDKFLKQAFVAAAIKFPSALFGMFCIFSVLIILDSTVPSAATAVVNFFEPAFMFIQRWLPLFYVPSLVVLPLSVRDIPAASGIKISLIVVGGWLSTLCVAGFTAIAVRKSVKTTLIDAEPMGKPSPFSTVEVWTWAGILLTSFVSALFYPTLLGTSARTCLLFLLSSTVLGYIVGTGLPSSVKKVFHPIICCALSSVLTAFAFGYFSKLGLDPVLGYYLTNASNNPGAGDILMGFLGSVILSVSFSMFKQRKLVNMHATEIFTSVIISTIFSLYSTALVGRLVQLEPSLTVSILPRRITVALALSIVSLFDGANPSLTAVRSTSTVSTIATPPKPSPNHQHHHRFRHPSSIPRFNPPHLLTINSLRLSSSFINNH